MRNSTPKLYEGWCSGCGIEITDIPSDDTSGVLNRTIECPNGCEDAIELKRQESPHMPVEIGATIRASEWLRMCWKKGVFW